MHMHLQSIVTLSLSLMVHSLFLRPQAEREHREDDGSAVDGDSVRFKSWLLVSALCEYLIAVFQLVNAFAAHGLRKVSLVGWIQSVWRFRGLDGVCPVSDSSHQRFE